MEQIQTITPSQLAEYWVQTCEKIHFSDPKFLLDSIISWSSQTDCTCSSCVESEFDRLNTYPYQPLLDALWLMGLNTPLPQEVSDEIAKIQTN